MKNLSLALNGVLIVAVAVLYYMQFSGNCCSAPEEEIVAEEVVSPDEEEPAEEVELLESAIGYINMDSLQTHYKLYKELINKLRAREKKYEKELNAKLSALEKKAIEFQKAAPTMTQFEGQTKQKELMKEEQDLYKLKDEFAVKFQNEEVKLYEQFQTNIEDFIAKYNEDKGYNIIIGASKLGNMVLYKNEGIDISSEVIKGLNEQYDNEKAAEKPAK